MRWFKHMSGLSRDEGVCRYLDAANDRQAAYGFLIRMLELVAEKMTPTGGAKECTLEYSLREWRRILDCNHNRLKMYLPLLDVIPWVSVELAESFYRVSVPKMLIWRDEYTRKSGQTPDNVAQSRADQSRTDQKESRDDGSLSGDLAKGLASRSPPHDFKVTNKMKEWATSRRPDVDIDLETQKFMVYEFPKPKTDWVAAWEKWILGANPNQFNQRGTVALTDRSQEMLKIAEFLRISVKDGESNTDYLKRVERANQERIKNLDG